MKNISIPFAAFAALTIFTLPAHAAIIISEIHPSGSSNGTYAADWIEITNTGTSAVNITGWKIDDNSNSFASGVALNGVTSINAGQSVVFLEGTIPTTASFINAWFNGSAPSGFAIGTYSGSGIGLGAGGDAMNVYDSSGVLQANVTFGSASAGVTFDNAAGLSGAISSLSSVGTNGAFTSFAGSEVGSPGAIPEPSTAGALVVALGILLHRRKR